MLTPTLLILGAYLWGAIPSAYLVARHRKGIDIRDYGSGNVGAANLMAHVGPWTGFLLGGFDSVAKGSLPVVVGKLLDEGLAIQVGAGLAAIAGHNWSLYIRFTGGRGVATAVGVVFGFFMWPEFLILTAVMGLMGRLIFRETGFMTFIAMLALPVLALIFGRPPEILFMALAIAGLLLIKRLTANWEPLPREHPQIRVMVNRVLWDRDVSRKSEWTRRRPR